MSGYHFIDEDERLEARMQEADDRFLERAWECEDCGALWDPGLHHTTRLDPAYVDIPQCPSCGGEPKN